MGQDLKEMFKKQRDKAQFKLKVGHEARFSEKMDAILPKKRMSFGVVKIAASVIVLFGLGVMAYLQVNRKIVIPVTVVDNNDQNNDDDSFSFGDLSPDLRKVENYYMANINLELAKLEVSDENKGMVDSFMERLSELNEDYEELTVELNQMGPNDQTITALIENLQLRLQLLQKLKKKLNQLNISKNEQII